MTTIADDVAINAGSGTTIRADDVSSSGKLSQVMRVDVGAEAEAELLGLGDSRLIVVGSAGLTTSVTTYASGDQLGTELTFASIVRAAKGATIQSAVLVDKAKVIGATDLYLFSAATTPAADNAANSWSDADMLNLIGIIHFTDVVTSANNYAVGAFSNLPLVVKPGSGTSIFGNLVTRTANAVFGAVGDLQVTLGVVRD